MSNRSCFGHILVALVFFIGMQTTVWCDQLTVKPAISVRQELNDNIFISEDFVLADAITTISPRLAVVEQTERLRAYLSARLDGVIYLDNSDLNALEQFYDGGLSYKTGEWSTLSLNGKYSRDSRPDRDILTTGLLLSNIDRTRYGVETSFDHVFSKRTGANITYVYGQDDYDPESLFTREVTDMRAHSIYLTPRRSFSLFNRLATGNLTVGYASYAFVNVLHSDADYYSATLGLKTPITERWDIDFNLGAYYVRNTYETIDFDPGTGSLIKTGQQSSSQGTVATALINHQREKGSSKATFSYDIKPSSARGGTTQRTLLELAIREKITYNFEWFVKAGYLVNRANAFELSRRDIDEETVFFIPRLEYTFFDDYFLSGAYNFTAVRDHITGSSRNRNLLYVVIGYRKSLIQ